jgi:Domain of unknown function (DUF4932)
LVNRRELIGLGGAFLLLPVEANARQIMPVGNRRIAVDPRIELISVVHLLGGYFLLGDANTNYKTNASKFFAPHSAHPVVESAKLLAKSTLSFDAVPDLLVRLTQPTALAWRKDIPMESPPGIPDATERHKFLAQLRDFAKVSRFHTFFDRHQNLYRRVVQAIEPMVVPNVLALEVYTGGSLGQWQVIAGLLLHDGGFGPRKIRKDGSLESYAVIGPYYQSIGDPDFVGQNRLQDLIVHEFAHSLINPLAEGNPAIVHQYADRFEPMRAQMKKVGAYETWETVVNEHVVRSVTARIAALQLGKAAGDAAVTMEVQRGFTYVPALIERLHVYESDRRRWPDLGTYFPQLMTAFG